MATVRLIVVVLGLGLVVLLGVQNLATALPLVFLGIASQPLPLGVWLVGAVLLGALTTLALTALLGSVANANPGRSAAYKYRPQSFYEPADSAAAPPPRSNTPPPYSSPASGRSPATPPSGSPNEGSTDDDPSWRDWTRLASPAQWSDWDSLSRAPKPETESAGAPTALDGVLNWLSSSRRQAFQQRQVNASMRELDDDWGELESRRYVPRGASPVEDSLDEIEQGWDGEARGSFEAAQSPRRVYRDGSIYAYSYRDEDSAATDHIYAPPDDAVYSDDGVAAYGESYPLRSDYEVGNGEDADESYASESYDGQTYPADSRDLADDRPLGEPEIAEDGVVDADYRVIEPPYRAAAEAAAAESVWSEGGREEGGDRDEWDEADDALTP